MIKITPSQAKACLNEKILEHIEYLQADSNSSLEDYIENCEKIGNLLLNIGAEFPFEMKPEEILLMANMNNLLRQMLIDFRTPTETINNNGKRQR